MAGGIESGGQQPAGGVPMGPLTAYPSVSYEVLRNDNITLQAPGSGGVISDTIQVLSPSLRIEGKQGANTYGVSAGATLGRHHLSTTDNYDDYNVAAYANLNPDSRVRLRLRAEHTDKHDARGSTNDPLLAIPNRYRQDSLGGIIGYGAPGAQGRFELELGGMDKRYDNNRAATVIDDRNEKYVGGTFFWRIAPKTSLLAQVKRTNIDYADPASTLDSSETAYYVGATWEATALTTGTVKVGGITKDFKNPGVADSSQLAWDGEVRWSPLTYSVWDFVISKRPRETTGAVGNFAESTNYGVQWTHAWTSQFSTAVRASYLIEDYAGIDRHDRISAIGLRGTYQMRRWFSVGADVNRSRRDSNLGAADYTDNIFMLFVKAAL
jgi:hypothetical protein